MSGIQSSRFYDNCTKLAPKPAYEPPRSAYESPRPTYEHPRAAHESPNPVYTSLLSTYQSSKPVYEYPKSTYEAPRPLMEGYYNGFPSPTSVENSSRPILTHTPPSSSDAERFSEANCVSPNKSTSQLAKSQGTPLTLKRDSKPEKYIRSCFLRFYHSEDFKDFKMKSSNKSCPNVINTSNNLKLTSNGGFSGTQTSNFKVPHHVQDNLRKIVKNHPNGLNCSMVPSLYRNMFKEELNYIKYGYRNLIQLIKDFPDTYHCFRLDSGDYKIFDKSLPLPANLDNESVEEQNDRFGGNKNKSTLFPDSALPESLYSPLTIEYPPDVVKLKEIIPRQFVSESTKEFDEIQLHVSEVYDSSKFWIILKEEYKDLLELMGEMQMHYSNTYDKLKIDEQYLESGMFCVAIYGTEFHRALLTKVILSDHKANIFYIDYGTVASVDSRNLYFLSNKFAYLPQQAIRARLHGIIPPVVQSPWSVDMTLKFLSLVQYRPLIGKIYHINREEQVLDVVLIDKSRRKDYVINDALVQSKLAIYYDQVKTESNSLNIVLSEPPVTKSRLKIKDLKELIAKHKRDTEL